MSLPKILNHSFTDATTRASLKRSCTLMPLDAAYPSIRLVNGIDNIGRSKQTGIRDVHCSREQLMLSVDTVAPKIKMKVIGVNPCAVNGLMAMPDSECELRHGDILEFVYGRHAFEIMFKPPPQKRENGDDSRISASTSVMIDECMEKNQGRWESIDNNQLLIYTSCGVRASKKIAGYDIDGTIIKTKSGKVFPVNTADWQFNYPNVAKKLRSLHDDEYKICFFSNQAGVGKGKVNLNEFKEKICSIIEKLSVPVQVFIATTDGYYRKPRPGMWLYLKEKQNNGHVIELEKSFYVGDAAGRSASGSGTLKRKKDHSLADRLFASNIDISFYTPEEHFLERKTEEWIRPEFKPNALALNIPLLEPEDALLTTNGCELIVLVGLPGSGKSHFAENCLKPHGYRIVNADTLGSVTKCLMRCEQELRLGHSVAVDNTNVDNETRYKFIKIAQSNDVPCRCFFMAASVAQIKHNIVYRNIVDSGHSKINDMVLNTMKKKYTNPTTDEGFKEVIRVNFKPDFSNERLEQLYRLYLLEK